MRKGTCLADLLFPLRSFVPSFSFLRHNFFSLSSVFFPLPPSSPNSPQSLLSIHHVGEVWFFFLFSISNLAFLLEGPFHFLSSPRTGETFFILSPPVRRPSTPHPVCLPVCPGLSSLPSPKTRNPPPVQPSPTEAERKEGRGGWTVGATSFFSPFSSSFHQSDLPQGHNFYKSAKNGGRGKREEMISGLPTTGEGGGRWLGRSSASRHLIPALPSTIPS